MFVQAKQALVDAPPGVCVVQELTNLYLAQRRIAQSFWAAVVDETLVFG